MDTIIEVTTTCGSEKAAQELASKLVTARLAACVQVSSPVISVYRWAGQVRQEHEWSCTAKSIPALRERLIDFIGANHSYDLPQIIVVQCTTSAAYAGWLREEVLSPTECDDSSSL